MSKEHVCPHLGNHLKYWEYTSYNEFASWLSMKIIKLK